MLQEYVILVNEKDEAIGSAEKLDAHKRGVLHRCFSIFIFDGRKNLLLQQRAHGKYHSGGLWTNTCCGHPRPGEDTILAGHRRLKEEMGFDCPLREVFSFAYKAALNNGLTENEYDHVLFGDYDGAIEMNPEEAAAYKWISIVDLKKEVVERPEEFTVWFKICLQEVLKVLRLEEKFQIF